MSAPCEDYITIPPMGYSQGKGGYRSEFAPLTQYGTTFGDSFCVFKLVVVTLVLPVARVPLPLHTSHPLRIHLVFSATSFTTD
jgi:hypothetical protein